MVVLCVTRAVMFMTRNTLMPSMSNRLRVEFGLEPDRRNNIFRNFPHTI